MNKSVKLISNITTRSRVQSGKGKSEYNNFSYKNLLFFQRELKPYQVKGVEHFPK
ncbi:MAG: hypothetical protein IPJ93_13810 [Bacteroidota bacterium]|nr:MAG: hypothetical protein IPJ93_13810 [Bacteroidota bacterium]